MNQLQSRKEKLIGIKSQYALQKKVVSRISKKRRKMASESFKAYLANTEQSKLLHEKLEPQLTALLEEELSAEWRLLRIETAMKKLQLSIRRDDIRNNRNLNPPAEEA